MHNFYNLTIEELESAIGTLGKEKYRAQQLYRWVYNKGMLDFSGMTNIPKSLRVLFNEMFDTRLLAVEKRSVSKDGSIKYGFLTHDSLIIESVFMPEEGRNTLCISSQIGCRMGCKFCVTGMIGFKRDLSVSEIVGQVVTVIHDLPDTEITNLVFMGMGEPMDNLENVLKSIDILKNPLGLDFSYRKITVSSVGLVGGLHSITPKTASLAISLNAADDETRTAIMPINRMYPIRDILSYVKGFGGTKRTRITFEYVLMKGINDSGKDAKLLGDLLKGIKCKINLIPFNESPHVDFKAPDEHTVRTFQEYLLDKRFTAIVRDSRGRDINGGCGQLGMEYMKTG